MPRPLGFLPLPSQPTLRPMFKTLGIAASGLDAQRQRMETFAQNIANADVTRVCIKADNLATAATASWIATGVFAASTVVFTTLLFVHKDKKTAAKLLEHDVGLGGAPLRDGGFVLGGSLRF